MARALWLLAGVAVGFIAAHQLGRSEQGRRVYDRVNGRIDGFTDAVVDGYRSRAAELKGAVARAGDTTE